MGSKVLQTQEEHIFNYFKSKYDIKCSNIHEIIENKVGERKTLLYIGCENGDYDICELLIRNNANVNYLSILNHFSTISTINTNLIEKLKVSALCAACNHVNNDTSIIKLLLGVDDIDVNIGDLHPLVYCCQNNNNKIAKLLLKHKNIDVNKEYSLNEKDIDTFFRDKKNKDTALIVSCKKGNTELVELLLGHDNIDVNKRGDNQETALIASCRKNNILCVNMLLNDPKIDINIENVFGETALHMFCDNNFPEDSESLIELLKREELDINKGFKDTVLHSAIIANNISLIRLLIKTGKLDIDKFNREGYTPLDLAIRQGFTKICKLLVKNKCNINLSDCEGYTPINIAVKYGFTKICKLLVKNKCNVDLSDYKFIEHKIVVQDEIMESILRSSETNYDINNINNNLICKKRKLSMIL
jgi:serine/threonine-protein phosphatase 6 regulatory ankyrin repeat subunit B